MENVNKQLLDALKGMVSYVFGDLEAGKSDVCDELRRLIAAAEQAQQAELVATSDDSSVVRDEVAAPKWVTCKHLRTRPDWAFVDCLDCGAVRTGFSGWNLAKNKWFPSRDAALFYERHGSLPDEFPAQKGGAA